MSYSKNNIVSIHIYLSKVILNINKIPSGAANYLKNLAGFILRNHSFISATIIITIFVGFGIQQHNLIPDGCDPFGYARQDRLFRQNGIVGGLKTSIDAQEATDLISIGKSLSSTSRIWGVGIAPHCHHYNEKTNSIILQYPPGTGFILSLFPEKQSLAYAYILGLAFTTYIFIQLCFIDKKSFSISILNILTFYAIIWIASFPASFGSTSVPLTVMLIFPAAYCCYMGFKRYSESKQIIYALLFGAFSGLLFAVRIPNALILIGFALFILFDNEIWNFNASKYHIRKIIYGFISFLIFGGILVILSNKLNAGGFLNTTYSSDDASLPQLDLTLAREKIHYFLYESYCAPIMWLSFIIYAATAIRSILKNSSKTHISTLVSTGLLFVISFAFFLTHQISAPYYMLPTSVAVIAMCLICINVSSESEIQSQADLKIKYFLLTCCTMFLITRIANFKDYNPWISMPKEITQTKSIFWADPTTGVINYYFNKYSGKLYAVRDDLQSEIIRLVNKLGYRQFVVADSPRIESILHKEMRKYPIYEIGALQSYYFNYPIWEINSKDVLAISNQDNGLVSTESDHIFSPQEVRNLVIKFNRIEDANDYKIVYLKLFNGNNFTLSAHSSVGSPIRITWRALDKNGKSMNNWGMRKDILFDVAPNMEGEIKIFIDKSSIFNANSLDISILQEWHLRAYEIGGSNINVSLWN